MLVLTRKHQEKIRIGDDIVITVLRTKGKAVRLGIEAPSAVPVVRGELVFGPVESEGGQGSALEPAESRPVVDAMKVEHNRGSAVRIESSWPTESPSHRSRTSRANGAQVTLRRIPREKLAEKLPRLASDAGPLRSLLDQRAST